MEIYSEQMEKLEAVDLTLGWLEEAQRIVQHAPVEGVEEKWHYEVAAEYANGGRDVVRVIDVPGVEAVQGWEERIPIRIYHPYTPVELEERKKEAAKGTMQERMERAEAAISLLGKTLETATKQWADFFAARGEG